MNNLQPFLPGANHWLGRRPKSALAQAKEQAQASALSSLSDLSSLFSPFIPKALLQPNKAKEHSRRRIFSLRCTFWAFLSQMLTPRTSCVEVVRMVQSFCSSNNLPVPRSGNSAYCQARQKLDENDLLKIHRHLDGELSKRLDRKWLWRDRKVIAVDGSTMRLADTKANQEAYPQASSQRPGCGFPAMQAVLCFCLHTGALRDWAHSKMHRHESPLLESLLGSMEKGSIVLGDRGFCSYKNLTLCLDNELDAVMRLHQKRKVDTREGTKLGNNDYLVEFKRPKYHKKHWSKDEWEQLPETLRVRVVKLEIKNRGFRPKWLWVVTTLTDPERYPKEALLELYERRWQVEVFIRDMKTTMGMEELRCKTPSMAQKEFLMYVIAYNLLRLLIADAAQMSSQEPHRISFKGAADALRQYRMALWWARKRCRKRRELKHALLLKIAEIKVGNRPGRSEPRVKKRRPKSYDYLTRPRSQMRVS